MKFEKNFWLHLYSVRQAVVVIDPDHQVEFLAVLRAELSKAVARPVRRARSV